MVINGCRSYVGALSIPQRKLGKISIEKMVVKPGTELVTASARSSLLGGQENKPVSFAYETEWHRMQEEDVGTWMTDLPIEQAQHDNMLDGRLYGHVLVGGLGLGYAATMLSHQPQIHEITVVEQSQDVVDLVWPHLKFHDETKMNIVVADLFDYLKQNTIPELSEPDDVFNGGFFDIWQSDGLFTFFDTVIPLRKLSFTVLDGPLWCWNEDVMRGQLRLQLHQLLAFARIRESGKPKLEEPFQLQSVEELMKEIPADRDTFEMHNWKCPFFKAIDEGVIDIDDDESTEIYSALYGLGNQTAMNILLTKGTAAIWSYMQSEGLIDPK